MNFLVKALKIYKVSSIALFPLKIIVFFYVKYKVELDPG